MDPMLDGFAQDRLMLPVCVSCDPGEALQASEAHFCHCRRLRSLSSGTNSVE